jgi:Undecaprenyl pyrophosphate synthetase (EC 2.5.1.31)
MPVGGTSGSSLYRVARLLIRAIGGYRLYEWLLERQVLSGPIPAHVGIVLDGNRRWAEERGLPQVARTPLRRRQA